MESKASNSKSSVLALSMLGDEQELTVEGADTGGHTVDVEKGTCGMDGGCEAIGSDRAVSADGAGGVSSADGRVTAFRVTVGFSGTMRKRR
jgi:hypothetical protein